MSAAPRTVSTAPDLRALGVAFGAVLIAVAVIVAVALVRPATTKAPAAPAAPAAVQFDHGWSSAASASRSLTVSGTKGGGINYTGIPYPANERSYVIRGTTGGGVIYNGIQFPAVDAATAPMQLAGIPEQAFLRTFPIVAPAKGFPYQGYQQTFTTLPTPAHTGKGTRLEE
jgi:hypothetical protein